MPGSLYGANHPHLSFISRVTQMCSEKIAQFVLNYTFLRPTKCSFHIHFLWFKQNCTHFTVRMQYCQPDSVRLQ